MRMTRGMTATRRPFDALGGDRSSCDPLAAPVPVDSAGAAAHLEVAGVLAEVRGRR